MNEIGDNYKKDIFFSTCGGGQLKTWGEETFEFDKHAFEFHKHTPQQR